MTTKQLNNVKQDLKEIDKYIEYLEEKKEKLEKDISRKKDIIKRIKNEKSINNENND